MRTEPKLSWFPTPYRSVLLFIVWLLLNQSIAPVHLFFGALLAVIIPWVSARFRNPQPLVERPILALRYLVRLFIDIIAANAQVVMLVLGPKARLKPAFIRIPLELEHELPLTILASTVSMTPGTVSADIYPAAEDIREGEHVQRWLLVHVLSMKDEAELIADIKTRYEQPLKEIFQC